jgi:hypothetical protein
MEVIQELIPAMGLTRTDGSAKIAGARVSAQVGLGEEEEMHAAGSGLTGDAVESGECLRKGRVGACLSDAYCYFGGHFSFPFLLFGRLRILPFMGKIVFSFFFWL